MLKTHVVISREVTINTNRITFTIKNYEITNVFTMVAWLVNGNNGFSRQLDNQRRTNCVAFELTTRFNSA